MSVSTSLRDLSSAVSWEIREGDCRELLQAMPDASVQACITSPPYWGLRDYGVAGIGLEDSLEQWVEELVEVFRHVRRVLRDDGTLWLNLGDAYNAGTRADRRPGRSLDGYGKHGYWSNPRIDKRVNVEGLKAKDLIGMPWMVAFALRADGWWLREDIIWHKLTPMPESVTDRCTRSHEYVFRLTKAARYYADNDAIREPLKPKTLTTFGTKRGQNGAGDLVKADNWARDVPDRQPRTGEDGEPVGANKRSVWAIASQAFPDAHFATFPPKLVEPMVLGSTRAGDVVLDPFSGAGTTGLVALRHGRSYVGLEMNPDYCEMARRRLREDQPLMNGAAEIGAAA